MLMKNKKSLIDNLVLRRLNSSDPLLFHQAFKKQGWNKPVEQYEQYLKLQASGERDIIVAEYRQLFAGYLTINWLSGYPPFREKNIPEVVDLNVLKKYQRLRIGTALMDEAEQRVQKKSKYIGIGFGVTKDYGAAQIIYIKRGYLLDGNGITKNSKPIPHGSTVVVDHDLAFYLTKQLS